MAASEEEKLSTTALANKLHVSVQKLFNTLRDYGWIQRAGDSWVLTKKGEFEGGSYRNSRKYGVYIVWPEHLEGHPLLVALSAEQRIDSENLSRHFTGVSVRLLHRILAELGLQRRTLRGWELTSRGRMLGGREEECLKSDSVCLSWPQSFLDNPVVVREISRLAQPVSYLQGEQEHDLFVENTRDTAPLSCVDGHQLTDRLRVYVCNFLYFEQIAHACHRALAVEQELYADFYIPSHNLYIDCWEEPLSAADVAGRLRKREVYAANELQHLEVNEQDLHRLEEILLERLRKLTGK